MSEPIESTITIAVPDWYVAPYPNMAFPHPQSDRLRQVTEWLDGEIYGLTEPGGPPVAGQIWQCMGDIHYGISQEVQATLKALIDLDVEFDAHADEYCEWPSELHCWRHGWPAARQWTSSPDADGLLPESTYRELRKTHLEDTYPADYLGFVEALDAYWPPDLLINRPEVATGSAA